MKLISINAILIIVNLFKYWINVSYFTYKKSKIIMIKVIINKFVLFKEKYEFIFVMHVRVGGELWSLTLLALLGLSSYLRQPRAPHLVLPGSLMLLTQLLSHWSNTVGGPHEKLSRWRTWKFHPDLDQKISSFKMPSNNLVCYGPGVVSYF